jgi:hypothetical protein
LNSTHRDQLIDRVERLLAPEGFDRATIGVAVDRVLAALPPSEEDVIVSVAAANTPDLASRLRALLPLPLRSMPAGVAHHGRHTVVCCRVATAELVHLTKAADALDARLQVQGLPEWATDARTPLSKLARQ